MMAYSDTWVQQAASTVGDYRGVAVSASGDYLYVSDNDSPRVIHRSTDKGASWNAALTIPSGSFNGRGRFVTCSQNGQKVYVPVSGGQIHYSSDYGVTWSQSGGTKAWVCAACSADGSTVYAVTYTQQEAYKSTDSGVTWQLISGLPAGISNYSYTSVACSDDGNIVYLCTYRGVLKSTDAGASWSTIVAEDLNGGETINGSSVSSDGTIIYVATDSHVFVSTNAGVSFSQANILTYQCYSIDCDSSGSKAIATSEAGFLHVSEDSGTTWAAVGPSATDWSAVGMSGDGSLLAAGQFWGQIFTSENVLVVALTVTAIDPTSGPTTGGTLVTITGTGFDNNTVATLDGLSLASHTVVSATTITGVTPANTAGFKDLAVTRP